MDQRLRSRHDDGRFGLDVALGDVRLQQRVQLEMEEQCQRAPVHVGWQLVLCRPIRQWRLHLLRRQDLAIHFGQGAECNQLFRGQRADVAVGVHGGDERGVFGDAGGPGVDGVEQPERAGDVCDGGALGESGERHGLQLWPVVRQPDGGVGQPGRRQPDGDQPDAGAGLLLHAVLGELLVLFDRDDGGGGDAEHAAGAEHGRQRLAGGSGGDDLSGRHGEGVHGRDVGGGRSQLRRGAAVAAGRQLGSVGRHARRAGRVHQHGRQVGHLGRLHRDGDVVLGHPDGLRQPVFDQLLVQGQQRDVGEPGGERHGREPVLHGQRAQQSERADGDARRGEHHERDRPELVEERAKPRRDGAAQAGRRGLDGADAGVGLYQRQHPRRGDGGVQGRAHDGQRDGAGGGQHLRLQVLFGEQPLLFAGGDQRADLHDGGGAGGEPEHADVLGGVADGDDHWLGRGEHAGAGGGAGHQRPDRRRGGRHDLRRQRDLWRRHAAGRRVRRLFRHRQFGGDFRADHRHALLRAGLQFQRDGNGGELPRQRRAGRHRDDLPGRADGAVRELDQLHRLHLRLDGRLRRHQLLYRRQHERGLRRDRRWGRDESFCPKLHRVGRKLYDRRCHLEQ